VNNEPRFKFITFDELMKTPRQSEGEETAYRRGYVQGCCAGLRAVYGETEMPDELWQFINQLLKWRLQTPRDRFVLPPEFGEE